jgi:hypothetical protein
LSTLCAPARLRNKSELLHLNLNITNLLHAPFCKARQEQLATSVKLAWKKSTRSLPEKKEAVNKKRVSRQNSERVQKMA